MSDESREQPTLERFRIRQRAIVELGLLAIRESSLEALLTAAAEIVRLATQTERSKVLERRPDGALLVRAGSGWPPGIVGELELPAGSDSQAHFALRSGVPTVVPDLMNEDRFEPNPIFLALGIRSGVNVVIEQSGEPFGVLEVDGLQPRAFDSDDVEFLQSAANILSVAIGRNEYQLERDHLVDVAAHEIRNPLAVVLGYAERLARHDDWAHGGPASAQSDVQQILDGARRVQRLIDSLLDLGRAERLGAEGDYESADLLDLTRAAIAEAVERHPQVAFEERYSVNAVTAQCSPDLAMLVLGNLVENAAKYSRAPETVTIRADVEDDEVRISVRDTCGGLAAEGLDRLFDRYFRGQSARDIRGFGIGLFVAHRAAEALGWRIRVQNYPDSGCEFIVAIPAARPHAGAPLGTPGLQRADAI